MVDLSKYLIVERFPYSNLSIKLVIPSGCGMKCPFCFNNLNRSTATHRESAFLINIVSSLKNIVSTAREYNPIRSISLDITGNEPTHNLSLFIDILKILKPIKNMFNSVVLTSNGENITNSMLLEYMGGVVDIVNISVHHYNQEKRCAAFGIKYSESILTDGRYKQITESLVTIGIKTSAVAVLYKKLDEPFDEFVDNFTKWCKENGFSDLRIRSNFYAKNSFFVEYMNSETFEDIPRIVAGLASKEFVCNDIHVKMMYGVTSLIPFVVGVEAVVDDNGQAYIDYGKQEPFIEDYVKHVYVAPSPSE